MLVIPSVTAYAWNDGKNGGSKEVKPGETTDLEDQNQGGSPGGTNPGGNQGNNQGGSPGGTNPGGNQGNNQGSPSPGSGTGKAPAYKEKIIKRQVVSRNTTKSTSTRTEDRTLYWNWRLKSGPGKMTVHRSTGSIKQVNSKMWQAGQRITVSFDKVGDYIVTSAQVKQRVKKITPVYKTTTTYLVTEYHEVFASDGTLLYPYMIRYYQTVTSTSYGRTQEEKEQPRELGEKEHRIRVTEVPGPPIELPTEEYLETTSSVTFSRDYIYTEDVIDALTDKGFELDVVYEITANTTITEAVIPQHQITRYKNMGTMTVTPVSWSATRTNGGKTVRIQAKFKYPKAAVAGKSPMVFRIKVKDKNGKTWILGDNIDVPVNAISGRFTNVPESQTGQLYQVKGLTRINDRQYKKNYGTITYANIKVK